MRLKLSIILFHLFYSILYCTALKNVLCEKENHCVCRYANGDAIDLTPFNISSTSPNFLFASNATVAYLYQPCVDQNFPQRNLSEKSALWKFTAANNSRNATFPALTLDDVLAIKVNGSNDTLVPLGAGDTAVFLDTERLINAAKISYTKNDQPSVVSLVCNINEPTSFKIDDMLRAPYLNSLILTSPVVCAHVPGAHNLSTGSALLLIFFIVFGIYFFGGMLVKKYLMGATGVEMIPNVDFWTSLPGLVKDGVIFAISCGKINATTYETI